MAKKPVPSVRFNLRASPEWVKRIGEAAKRLGLSKAAYIKMAVSERLDADERAARRD